jgi:hypothetical protein
LLAVVSSISALHVLLEPKKIPNKKLGVIFRKKTLEEKCREIEVKYGNDDNHLLFSMIIFWLKMKKKFKQG